MSKVFQVYLGQAYNPERDWTSELRSRSGYKPFKGSTGCAAFTMRNPKILDQMTAFVIEYGQSQAPNWEKNLRANLPTYHVELAVSAGGKASPFVINSSQIEKVSIQYCHHFVQLLITRSRCDNSGCMTVLANRTQTLLS